MKNKIKNSIKTVGGCLLLSAALASCTGNFETWNTNPNNATEEQMDHDNLKTGSFFTQMERSVLVVGKDKGGDYQVKEILDADIFADYAASVGEYASAGRYHNAHYKLFKGWYDSPFKGAYTDIMQPWLSIHKYAADKTENSIKAGEALATVVKVLAMSRISDMYGPIPYTKFGTSINVPYDSQKDVYYAFFKELGEAVTVLTDYYNADNTAKLMADYDYIYSGDVSKWIKFANTLRLRLSLRISEVDEAKAKEEAKAALTQELGVMKESGDDAILHQSATLSFLNPLWEVSESFKDIRMGATMDSYLNGYNDPRLPLYFRTAANDGKYHGVRGGLVINSKAAYEKPYSGYNYDQGSNLSWMYAAEAWFLKAEAKLKWGDIVAETAQECYEQGIRTSFASKGASGADTYINDAVSKPTDYVDPLGAASMSAMSTITVKWDEYASDAQKLERIITQKYLAIFPDGLEAWSEFRRTGYPKIFPIVTNQSGGEVPNGDYIKRLKFPSSEYDNNAGNVGAAVGLLGGADNAGTRLWWDTK